MNSKCIFCLSETATFSTDEHILPESLGGKLLLPSGFVCYKCQNYFGAKVEKTALAEHPFNILRLFLVVPSKRKRPISIPLEGFGTVSRAETSPGSVLSVDLNSGQLILKPAPKSVKVGDELKFDFKYRVKEKRSICRALLKMGLEMSAQNDREDVFSSRYEPARRFARCPKKTDQWNYLEYVDWAVLVKLLGNKRSFKDAEDHVRLMIIKSECGSIVFYLKLYFVEMYVPLESSSECLKDKRFHEKKFVLRQG